MREGWTEEKCKAIEKTMAAVMVVWFVLEVLF